VVVTGRVDASTNAAVRSVCACCAAAVVSWIVPGASTIPGGKPVTDVPGHRPRFAETTVAPVLVTVEPASTE
jgi:hypothetical protein